MANIGMMFDATQVKPAAGPPPPVPTDWYNVMITESQMKETKDHTGGYLELVLKILDGPMAGRLAWDRLNLYNANPVAVEIAQGALSAICHATQVFQVQDSSVLHGKPLMARIVEKPAAGGYDASNEVKGYAAIGAKESKNAANGAVPGHGFHPDAPPFAAPTAPGPTFGPPAPAAPVYTPPVAAPPVAAPTFTPPWNSAAAAPPVAAPPAAPAPGNTPPWAR